MARSARARCDRGQGRMLGTNRLRGGEATAQGLLFVRDGQETVEQAVIDLDGCLAERPTLLELPETGVQLLALVLKPQVAVVMRLGFAHELRGNLIAMTPGVGLTDGARPHPGFHNEFTLWKRHELPSPMPGVWIGGMPGSHLASREKFAVLAGRPEVVMDQFSFYLNPRVSISRTASEPDVA